MRVRHLLAALVAAAGTATAADAPPGFTPIFNGKDLTGWKATGKAEAWAVENGTIVCKSGGGGYLLTEKEYGNFELRFAYKWSKEGGNSGIGLRTPFKGDPAYQGMEIQLIDDAGWEKVHKFKLQPYQHTGSIYDVQPAKQQANNPIGEWNTVRVVAKGRDLLIEQNGKELVKANLDAYPDKADKNHPGLKREKGHLGFQSYNIRVEFKDVVVKELE
ncbi:DUF1080 domain-containing protein [bacterium]|nr:DUF1080 domain-containing protein [bacterium]